MDLSRTRFLDRQTFTDFPGGNLRDADLVAEAPVRDSDRSDMIMIHVEVQRPRRRIFPFRMWQYYALLRFRYNAPVLPIALYLAPGAGGNVIEVYTEGALDRPTLRFEYQAIGLPDLDASGYDATPLEAALSAAMRSTDSDAVSRKFHILQAIATGNVDDAQKVLLGTVLETFLPLTGPQQIAEFAEQIRASGATETQQMTTVYDLYKQSSINQGIEQGIEQGLVQGREAGKREGARTMLLEALRVRFGDDAIGSDNQDRILRLDDDAQIRNLFRRCLTAPTLDDVGLFEDIQ